MAAQRTRREAAPATDDASSVRRAGDGSAAAGSATPAFVGRDDSLAAITGALERGPALVLVEGEAGIGKSRLIQEFLARPTTTDRRLVALCPPLPEPLTLGPVVEAVRHTVDRVAELGLTGLGGALRPLFPEWTDQLPPVPEPLEDARAARHRLFAALVEVIDRLGVELLVVEDAHWADRATLEFLVFLTAGQQSPPSLLVSYRREDVPDWSPLWQLASRLPAGTTQERLMLAPLDEVDTASLISSMLDGEPLSEEFATLLHERTDGVPLAVEESVRLLADRHDVLRYDGAWLRRSLEELEVPPTVRDSVLERVRRRSRDAQLLVQAAAVLTDGMDEAIACAITGLPPARARAGLSEALVVAVLQEDEGGRVSFRHALMGQAVYEAMSGLERRALHLAAGRALETANPALVAQLARHFREAGDTDKWAKYAEQAADRLIESNDHTRAARLLNDVLVNAQLSAHEGARLAPKLARALLVRREAADDLDHAVVRTLQTVLDSEELCPAEQAGIRNHLGRMQMNLGDWGAGYRDLELAAANLGDHPVEAARVMTYLGWPYVGLRPVSFHRQWLQRAAEFDSSVQSPVDRLNLRADRATALALLGDDEGWNLAAELPLTASRRDERRTLARIYLNLAAAALWWGRYEDAGRRLAIARQLSEADDISALSYRLSTVQAELDWFSGRWDGLAGQLTALLEVDEVLPPAYSSVLCVAGHVSATKGAAGQAKDHFQLALDRAHAQGMVDDALAPSAGLGRLWLEEGRVDDSLRVTAEASSVVEAKRIWIWATDIAPVRVEALVATGRVEEAGRLVARFARGLRGLDAPAPRAALTTCRAILADHQDEPDRAAAAFARAARAWERLPRPYDALRSRERQAHCLLAAGKTEAGLALLSEVLQGLTDLGAGGDADRVVLELRRRGVDARRRSVGRPGYGDRLSPRELEVVRLLVTGKTNREIAEALFVAPKTVGRHLDSARRKLKVHSRTALAVAVVEAGIVTGSGASSRAE